VDVAKLPLVWEEHPLNPLIQPPWPEFLIADPTVLVPADSPDGQWHLFAHGILLGVHHFVSPDGIRWERIGRVVQGMRPYIIKEDGYYLFFEKVTSPIRSAIAFVHSHDLKTWTEPREVLTPSLHWEGRIARTNGNPCVVRRGGTYWLYYSAGLSWLRDCGFPEPRYVGVARSHRLTGPYEKHPDPILWPSASVPHRNLGAGAIKVLDDPESGTLLGFTNGIFTDREGRSRSDIRLLASSDGLRWTEVSDTPLVKPTDGWKRALVYALDVRRVGDAFWMYFNARDGWFLGRERIGLAVGWRRKAL
jgi:hypothetical protein